MSKVKVCVGLSGGIDSACAALLLKEQGHDICGLTLHTAYFPDEALSRARKFCDQLGIAHHIYDISRRFEEKVVDYLTDSYCRAETPNPCCICNRDIKFFLLWEKASELGCEYCATGHYACLRKENGLICLEQAADSRKSQEYFLALVDKDILARVIFPLCRINKAEVQEKVRQFPFFVKGLPESQEICFVKNARYRDFIVNRISDPASFQGEIRHADGTVLGRHQGIFRYTYGQREGLGIAWKEPLYVIDILPGNNTVVVGEKRYLRSDTCTIGRLNWFYRPAVYRDVTVKIRYNSRFWPCTYVLEKENRLECRLDGMEDLAAPGQVAVLYQGKRVVCAGIIQKQGIADSV